MFIQFFALAFVASSGAWADTSTWAQFCDDDACSVNCGESVSVNDPGCLNEGGRQSILFHGLNTQQVALAVSPEPNCLCQSSCLDAVLSRSSSGFQGGCTNLAELGYSSAQSFHFIFEYINVQTGGLCQSDNCTGPGQTGQSGSTYGVQTGTGSSENPPVVQPGTGSSENGASAIGASSGGAYVGHDASGSTPSNSGGGSSGRYVDTPDSSTSGSSPATVPDTSNSGSYDAGAPDTGISGSSYDSTSAGSGY